MKEGNIDYDSIPVFYCKLCLSLRILDIDSMADSDYCDECGSTDIESTTIDKWEELYKLKYRKKYIDNY